MRRPSTTLNSRQANSNSVRLENRFRVAADPAWAESLTRIAESHAPDAVYEEARSVFSDDELLVLSIGVATINAWNRLAIGFRLQHPADRKRAA
jgi:alkylhydroperoxidase family enzyme